MLNRAIRRLALPKPRRWLRLAVLSLVALTLSAVIVYARTGGGLEISWSTVDVGGGASSGGSYGVRGTAGQPDAEGNGMAGGSYALRGGFWSVLLSTCLNEFADVPPDNAFYTFVRCLSCRNILSGYIDGTFRPGNSVTRGQLSKIVSNSAGFNEPHAEQTFQDVPVDNVFHIFIERLASRGVIAGYPCGATGEPCVPPDNRPYFRPGNNVTRGQTSKITAIARGLPNPPPGQWTFQDVPEGSTFWSWIEALATAGAINGYTCGGTGEPCIPPENRPYFRSGNNVTRGQSAKIVANAFFPNCQTP